MIDFYKPLCLILLFPFFTWAQSNYKHGYVVTAKGDTLHGFIDYQDWSSNPTSVSFKSAVDDRNHQKFTTNDINFFNVEGFETYKKFTCSISMDGTNTMHLNTGRDTSFALETVFLQVLQKGKNVALYSYTDDIKTRFYIGESPDYTPTELVYRIYDDIATNGTTVTENTYLKQLFALANKHNVLDDDLTNIFQKSNYIKPDLLTIVSKINGVSKTEFSKKYTAHAKFNFYVSAAVNISYTSSSGDSPFTAGGGKSYTSYEPAVSFGLNLIPNPNTGKVEFRGALSFAETQFNSVYQLKVSPYVGVKASFDQLGVSFIPQAIYNFYNSESFKFYCGVGIAFTYFNYSNAAFVSQNPATPITDIAANDPYHFNPFDESFLLEAGVRFNKKFGIFANAAIPTATTRGGYFQLTSSNKQIGIVYLFGK
jgi:hypothetical protein